MISPRSQPVPKPESLGPAIRVRIRARDRVRVGLRLRLRLRLRPRLMLRCLLEFVLLLALLHVPQRPITLGDAIMETLRFVHLRVRVREDRARGEGGG